MRFQDLAVEMTRRACDGFFRAARFVPSDKLEWKPMDNGRSTLDLAQEIAESATWGTGILKARAFPPFDPSDYQKMMERRKEWTTLDQCESVMRENLDALFKAVEDLPDSDLGARVELPFGPDMNFTLAEIALVQYWNATYHTGQVNYIQTLLGDFEMH